MDFRNTFEPFDADKAARLADFFEDMLSRKGLLLDGDPTLTVMQPMTLAQYRSLIGTLRNQPIDLAAGFAPALADALGQSDSPIIPILVATLDAIDTDDWAEIVDNVLANLGLPHRKGEAVPQAAAAAEEVPALVALVLHPGQTPTAAMLEAHDEAVRAIGPARAEEARHGISMATGAPADKIYFRKADEDVDIQEMVEAAVNAAQDAEFGESLRGNDPGDSDPLDSLRKNDGHDLLQRMLSRGAFGRR